MTLAELRDVFFPELSIKTMHNKAAAGLLPARAGNVYDVRDVAMWWDAKRAATIGYDRSQKPSRWIASPAR